MDTSALVAEAIAALNALLNIIAQIRANSGQTDAQLLAAAQTLDKANDQLLATLQAALTSPAPPQAS